METKNQFEEAERNRKALLSVLEDIRHKEAELRVKNENMKIFQNIISELSVSPFLIDGKVKELASLINEKVSKALNIERVNIWLFNESQTELICIDAYEHSKNLHTEGAILHEKEFGNEFYYLKTHKFVDANDPLTDPRTAGYVERYLIPNNITSMLDAAIRHGNKNVGTLCFEHVKKQHVWEIEEITFASQLADQIAICISNHERKLAEEKLKESEKQYRLISENTADTIAVFDMNMIHTYVSPSVRWMLGYTPQEVMNLGLKGILTEESYERAINQLKLEMELELSGKAVPNRHFVFETKEICKDGKIIDVESIVSFIRDENGKVTNILTVSRDITEQNKLKKELGESEEKFRSIFENSTIGIYRTTPSGEILLANPALIKMLGFSSFDELSIRNLNSEGFEPGYNREEFLKQFESISEIIGLESKWSRKDGSFVYVRENSRAIKNDAGEILYIEGSVEDITEKKKLEDELKEREQKLRLLVEGTSYFFFYTHDNHGNVTYVSPSVEEITGYKVDEWINQNHWFTTDSKINKEASEHTRKMLAGEKVPNPFYLEILNKAKEKILLELYEAPIYDGNKIVGLQGIAHDVTEKMRLNEKIETLSSAIEQSPFSVVISDTDGNIEFVNPRFTEITGYSYEEAIGKNPRILKSGLHDKEFYKDLWDSIKTGKTWKGEICNKKNDNTFYWENAIISPVIDSKGNITHFVGIKEDITSKKELNDKLQKSEEEFRSIWENSIDAMRLVDEDGIIINVNDAYCELLKITKDNLIGMPFNVSYVITDDDKSLDHYKKRFRERKIERKFETQIRLHNDETIWVELTNSFIEMPNGKPLLLSIFRNVTERKMMMNDLIVAREKAEASDKLKSEFLAQISHEIRSPLNVILNFNSLLRSEYGNLEKEDVDDAFNGISNSSQRIIRTIDLILNSSEMQLGSYSPIFEKIDIYERIVVKSYNELKRLAETRNLELKIQKLTDKVTAKCDEYSVFQTVINLVDNAIKYTKEGTIEIRLLRNEKKKLQIEVEDTGIGMSEEFLGKLFQPFSQEQTGYTRKFEGTGLGLSLVKKYCDLNGIKIDVKSKKDVGTTFTLTF